MGRLWFLTNGLEMSCPRFAPIWQHNRWMSGTGWLRRLLLIMLITGALLGCSGTGSADQGGSEDRPDAAELIVDRLPNMRLIDVMDVRPHHVDSIYVLRSVEAASQDSVLGRGLRHQFVSLRDDVAVAVELRDYLDPDSAWRHRLDGGPWERAEAVDAGGLEILRLPSRPFDGWRGWQVRTVIGPWLLDFGVIMEEAAFESSDAALQAGRAALSDVLVAQTQAIPVTPAEVDPFDRRLRLAERWSLPLIVALMYSALWVAGRAAGLRSRLRTAVRRLGRWFEPLEGVDEVPVWFLARRARWRHRLVTGTGAIGFALGAYLTLQRGWIYAWPAMLVGWLLAVGVGRFLLLSDEGGDGGYRRRCRTERWPWIIAGFFYFAVLLGGLWLVTTGVLTVVLGAVDDHAEAEPLIRFATSMVVGGAVLLLAVPWVSRWLRRWDRRRLTSVAELDPRPPVVYLRSFADDRVRIATIRGARHALIDYMAPGGRDRLDEVVAWAFWRTGPVVAVGEPGRPASELGPAMEFYADEDWRDAVRAHVQSAPVIAVCLGSSEGVRWELQHLVAAGAANRCLFVVPPTDPLDVLQRLRSLVEMTGSTVDEAQLGALAVRPVLLLRLVDDTLIAYTGARFDSIEYEAAIELALYQIGSEGLMPSTEPEPSSAPATLPPPRVRRESTRWFVPLLIANVTGLAAAAVVTQQPPLPVVEAAWARSAINELATCDGPDDLLSVDGQHVIAVCPATREVAVTDASGRSHVLELGGHPTVAAALSAERVVVLDRRAPILTEISLAPLAILSERADLPGPASAAVVDGEQLVLVHPAEAAISLRDAHTLSPVADHQVGGMPWDIALTDVNTMLVADLMRDGLRQFSVMDLNADAVEAVSSGSFGALSDDGQGVLGLGVRDRELVSFEDPGSERFELPEVPRDALRAGDLMIVALQSKVVAYCSDGRELWHIDAMLPSLALLGDDQLVVSDRYSNQLGVYELTPEPGGVEGGDNC